MLHDYLVSDEILKYANNNAQIFCVGKEKGNHSFTQEECNKALVQYAKDGYKVAIGSKGGTLMCLVEVPKKRSTYFIMMLK